MSQELYMAGETLESIWSRFTGRDINQDEYDAMVAFARMHVRRGC